MTFGQRVAMTLRWAAFELSAGLAILAVCTFGLMSYEPIPDDSPFASPIPFTAIFTLGVMVGIALIVWAHFKANK